MHFSFLTIIVALTASIAVSASYGNEYAVCLTDPDCCNVHWAKMASMYAKFSPNRHEVAARAARRDIRSSGSAIALHNQIRFAHLLDSSSLMNDLARHITRDGIKSTALKNTIPIIVLTLCYFILCITGKGAQ
ncbi:hypothetical protein F4604DRAFT_1899030 [Suillus subluteus]|nr:hypothetical protein F4604DRAFT_1899030 [Suillus subluteus]